ncbi:MAG TPA: OB-fold nucleic acid binding domain-containing protein [Candidatus Acidoferrales bacterium]|nr:OB-fold nucleic acid binding domain-containing protein [Candidatus Acidoferrales bacterium]
MVLLLKVQENGDSLSDNVASIYERLADTIPRDEFIERVRKKVEDMSGLCDDKTAAMLVAHELGIDTVVQIGQIDGQMRAVAFVGKLTHLSPTREFSRNGDVGHVANIVVSDETGSIRVVLWNDLATHAEELQVGQTLKIGGTVRAGPYGLEVNAREIEIDESVQNMEVATATDKEKIADLIAGLNSVEVAGVILEVGSVRTFSKRDGSMGKVANVVIGDETGKVRVTLWDNMAEKTVDLILGEVLCISNGYTRERYGRLEVNVGDRGSLRTEVRGVEFVERVTPIANVQEKALCSVEGVIENVGPLREFTRSNGSVGQVRNIVLKDDTGEMRVALWGDKALAVAEENVHGKVILRDCFPKSGFGNQLELSVDWRSGLALASTVDDGARDNTTSQEAEGHNTTSQEAEEVITGMIISSAASVCVDNGTDYVTFERASSNLMLEVGEEVTVVGDRTNDALRVRSVSKIPQDAASRKVATIKRRLDALNSSKQ